MSDYYTFQQLAQTLGIAEASITALQAKGLLQPTVKDGRSFFSSRQAHCLRAALGWARKRQNRFARGLREGGRTLVCAHERDEELG